MDLKEKASYILGLIEGAKLDVAKEENKIVRNIAELLKDVAQKVEDIEKNCDENTSLIDEIDEDLAKIEKHIYKCGGSCKGLSGDKNCDCSENDEKEDFLEEGNYEVVCPNCKRTVILDDEIFEKEDILCPECGEKINFDFKNVEEED